jgi:hypothetical protein
MVERLSLSRGTAAVMLLLLLVLYWLCRQVPECVKSVVLFVVQGAIDDFDSHT